MVGFEERGPWRSEEVGSLHIPLVSAPFVGFRAVPFAPVATCNVNAPSVVAGDDDALFVVANNDLSSINATLSLEMADVDAALELVSGNDDAPLVVFRNDLPSIDTALSSGMDTDVDAASALVSLGFATDTSITSPVDGDRPLATIDGVVSSVA